MVHKMGATGKSPNPECHVQRDYLIFTPGLFSQIFVFQGPLAYFTVLILFHCPALIKAVTPVVSVLWNQNVPLAGNGKVNRN